MGSDAEAVVRESPVPVLLGAPTGGKKRFQKSALAGPLRLPAMN